MFKSLLILLSASALIISSIAAADDHKQTLNHIEFQLQAEREVDNDLTSAVLVVEDEHPDPARLAASINRTMTWALEKAKATPGIDIRSGNYRTVPVHDQQRRLTHWRASQELRLEGTEVEVLNRLIGELQERLQVRSMSFSITPARQAAVMKELTGEALDGFRERAAWIAGRLGAGDYDIVQLRIDDGGGRISPPDTMMRTMSVPESVPVATEPGVSRLGVGIHAIIRLRD